MKIVEKEFNKCAINPYVMCVHSNGTDCKVWNVRCKYNCHLKQGEE